MSLFYPTPKKDYIVCVATNSTHMLPTGQFFYLKMKQNKVGNFAIQDGHCCWVLGKEFDMEGVKYVHLTAKLELDDPIPEEQLESLSISEILKTYGIEGIGLEVSLMRKVESLCANRNT